MNLKALEERLYPAHLTIPVEYHDFWTAGFTVQQAQAAIDQFVPEFSSDLYAAVKKYVLHGNALIFLKDENLEILKNKVVAEFSLLMHSTMPTKEMIKQVILFMVEGA